MSKLSGWYDNKVIGALGPVSCLYAVGLRDPNFELLARCIHEYQ